MGHVDAAIAARADEHALARKLRRGPTVGGALGEIYAEAGVVRMVPVPVDALVVAGHVRLEGAAPGRDSEGLGRGPALARQAADHDLLVAFGEVELLAVRGESAGRNPEARL